MSAQQYHGEKGVNGISASRLWVMGLTSVLIILFHWGGSSTLIQRIIAMCGYLGVEIFLFLSGYGIYHSLARRTPLAAFYRRRAVRIFPASIVAGIMFVMVRHIGVPELYSYTSLNFKLAFVGLDVWYIRTQLIFYLIAPLVFALFKSRCSIPLLVFLYSVLAAALIFPGSPFHLSFHGENAFFWNTTIVWTIKRFPSFVAGMYVGHCLHEGICTRVLGVMATLSGFAFLVVFGLALSGTIPHSVRQGFEIFLFPCWYYVVAGLAMMRNLVPGIVTGCVEWIGRHSLEIFLTHAAVFACSKVLFGRSSPLVFVCSCAVFLLASVFVNRLAAGIVRKLS